MKKVEELNYYDLLNVDQSASPDEIEKAYLLSMAAFRPDWFATYSLLTEEERDKSLRRVELAFEVLSDPVKRRKYDRLLSLTPAGQPPSTLVEKSRPMARPGAAEAPSGFWGKLRSYLKPREDEAAQTASREPAKAETPSLSEGYALSIGPYLRTVRTSRGLSLEQVAQSTRINVIYLRALEEEHYDQLPSESHVQYMLAAYAKSLKVDANRVIRDYKASRKPPTTDH